MMERLYGRQESVAWWRAVCAAVAAGGIVCAVAAAGAWQVKIQTDRRLEGVVRESVAYQRALTAMAERVDECVGHLVEAQEALGECQAAMR